MASSSLLKSPLHNSVAQAVYDEIQNRNARYYYFLGKTISWDDDTNPPYPIDSFDYELKTRNEIITLKEIKSTDVAFVIPRVNWVSGQIWDMYDDQYSDEVQGINLISGGYGYSDPPAILIMRRKSIRQFPNGQRVALYYVDKINKYVTVPYEDMQWGATFESSTIDQLVYSAEYKDKVVVEHYDGTTTEVTPEMAENIIALYKKINEANRAKMLDMLEASSKHFQTIAKFSKE